MKSIRYDRIRRSKGVEINMAPMIDMIFILLIFFLVTTSFMRESGVDVQRPEAQSAEIKEKNNLIVGITDGGVIYIEGKPIDLRLVRARMERFLGEIPEGSVVVVADKESHTGTVVQVLDACRLAGVKNISLAADKSKR
jgi:biopolymer transport protein ExbD